MQQPVHTMPCFTPARTRKSVCHAPSIQMTLYFVSQYYLIRREAIFKKPRGCGHTTPACYELVTAMCVVCFSFCVMLVIIIATTTRQRYHRTQATCTLAKAAAMGRMSIMFFLVRAAVMGRMPATMFLLVAAVMGRIPAIIQCHHFLSVP